MIDNEVKNKDRIDKRYTHTHTHADPFDGRYDGSSRTKS